MMKKQLLMLEKHALIRFQTEFILCGLYLVQAKL